MPKELPTIVTPGLQIADFRDSLTGTLAADSQGKTLVLFFYAVTTRGWKLLRDKLLTWRLAQPGRSIEAYVGTDHGITQPEALRQMLADKVKLLFPDNYSGVFHPKVVWLASDVNQVLWIASNNLTQDGLSKNVEFACTFAAEVLPAGFKAWADAIAASSSPWTKSAIDGYEAERQKYGAKQARIGTFTWSRRTKPKLPPAPPAPPVPPTPKSVLVLEVMPLETGGDGRQVQIPLGVASSYFGLNPKVGSKSVKLCLADTNQYRSLTMTQFANKTARLVINELDYNDRPCLVVFVPKASASYEFEIVAQAIEPARYAQLYAKCVNRTRAGSKRWGFL